MPKLCSKEGCNTPVFSKGLCQWHWKVLKVSQPLAQTNKHPAKPFRVKPIKKVSDKQARLNALYNVAATQYKKDNPFCKAQLHGCQGETHHVHHLFSGASKSKYFLDQAEWLPVCNHCHHVIHDVLSKEDAITMGFKKVE